MEIDRSTYNREYYLRNQVDISNRKKKLYKESAAYRKRAAEARARYQVNKRTELGGYVLREYNEKPVKVLKIGKVLKLLNLSRKTIVAWEGLSIIPAPLSVFGVSRCYTDHQVSLLGLLVEAKEQGKTDVELKKSFKKKIRGQWLKGL